MTFDDTAWGKEDEEIINQELGEVAVTDDLDFYFETPWTNLDLFRNKFENVPERNLYVERRRSRSGRSGCPDVSYF